MSLLESALRMEDREEIARLKKELAQLRAAPSAVAQTEAAGFPEWSVDAAEYDKLYRAARSLRSACKDRLPPGHYQKLDEECGEIDALLNPTRHSAASTPALSESSPKSPSVPAVAGGGEDGADTRRLDWLEENMGYVGGGSGGIYSFSTPIDAECGMLRYAIDAAIAATKAKEGKNL